MLIMKTFLLRMLGETYVSIGMVDGIKVIERMSGLSVSAPEYSHSPNRTYAIMQEGKLKYLAFYDSHHKQVKVIDFMHKHFGICPHVHYNLDHSDKGITPSEDDWTLIRKLKKGLRVK
ncbi:MAG: hypothetical protein WC196_05030 [Bacilli bacterium]|nr:hypothetical protein [Bacilli bacterium]